LKLNNYKITFTLFILSLAFTLKAQNSDPYTFPIRPNKTNFLSGTMGELRSSHFHAGIDIKTGGKIGEAVHATKRGYITRIKVSTAGYGNALYILHPDGNTSVYAHLHEFDEEIQKYVKEEQYKQQTFEIELFPEPYQFSYKTQEVIGVSGNTGGSMGPHLHFEIRDSQQRVLNPLHYGFKEIRDNIPPILQGFVIRPMNEDSKVENEFKRQNIPYNRTGFNYTVEDTISAIGKIGLELWGHDKLNGSANKNGISIIEVNVNNELQYRQNIDVMSFGLQRHILVHYPYDVKVTSGARYHKLYVDDGNSLKYYDTKNENGTLNIKNGEVYNISIKMLDPYGNTSKLEMVIKGEQARSRLDKSIDFELDELEYMVDDDYLKIYAQSNCNDDAEELNLNFDKKIKSINPSYYLDSVAVYIWSLKKGIPTSILNCEKGMSINPIKQIVPYSETSISELNMDISFSKYSLFDTIYFQTDYEIITKDSLEIFSLNPRTLPLKSYIEIELNPQLNHYDEEKSHVYKTDDTGNFSFEGGEWNNGKLKFSTRELANYTILSDTAPPTIKPNGNLSYIIIDNLSGIASYEAHLNGEWILMKYEPKDDLIWVEWPDTPIEKNGEFVLMVIDNAGNETEYITKL